MSGFNVSAEYHQLESVRVHLPGYETFAGILDPIPNLFRSDFSLRQGQAEHDTLTETLEREGVDVHYLHDDLAAGGEFRELLDDVEIDLVNVDEGRRDAVGRTIRTQLHDLSPFEKIQIVASNMELTRRGHDADLAKADADLVRDGRRDTTNICFEQPLSNLYFQRDQQFVTPRGPVMSSPAYATRLQEVDLCRRAWEAVGADIVHHTSPDKKIEGGDYIPVGEFALLGVYEEDGDADGGLRTNLETALDLLDKDVFGHDEVALVRAPYDTDARIQREHGASSETGMDIMHLDTWFNIAASDIAVAREPLVENATVEVFVRHGSAYEHVETRTFATYLREKGFTIVPVAFDERAIGTNFLTLDSGTVLAPCYTDDDNGYDADENVTLERMRDAGIDIVPNGQGVPIEELRSGYGGIHCMTTPLNRRA